MGQHKSNPNVELARQGLLPPKPKKLSKRQRDAILYMEVMKKLEEKVPGFSALEPYMPQQPNGLGNRFLICTIQVRVLSGVPRGPLAQFG